MFLPDKYCCLCDRLKNFRENNKKLYPDYYNGAVPSFGNINATLLIVGLAPGLHGANQTGRPFTNDFAGDILYSVLKENGLTKGSYGKRAGDGLELLDTRVTNAVRCVPPQNKPTGDEFARCIPFLKAEIAAMDNLKCILSLGVDSHRAVIKALNLKQSAFPFKHGAIHHPTDKITLADSYHTSRYNINTGVLTKQMFFDVIENIKNNILPLG